jgi:hypothetical protein
MQKLSKFEIAVRSSSGLAGIETSAHDAKAAAAAKHLLHAAPRTSDIVHASPGFRLIPRLATAEL